MFIETVLGPVSSDRLGVIAPHEHFFIDTTFEAQTPETEKALELFRSDVGIGTSETVDANGDTLIP